MIKGDYPAPTPAPTPTPTTTPEPAVWTVRFDANGGTGSMAAQSFTDGVAQVLNAVLFTRFGFDFTGWATSANGDVVYSDRQSITASSDLALYAKWSETIAGHSDSGSGSASGKSAAKAQTVNGALYDRSGVLVGTVQVKFGKPGKKGVKITASATVIQGGKSKKISAKGATLALGGAAASIAFKDPIGEMQLVMVGDGAFTLKNSKYVMAESDIGGNWTRKNTKVYVDMTSASLPAGTIESLLPDGESVVAKGGKWTFAKGASVKWAKDKKTKVSGLVVDDSKGKTNLSSLKLTYTPNTGMFKGSFKVYALEESKGKTKLKKYTVNVVGFVVDGVGYGTASIKKPAAGPWAVRVE